jgi:pilus assembly protein Flp/PilA
MYIQIRPVQWEKSKTVRRCNTMLFAPKEKGQGLIEYAFILILIAVVVIAVLLILGPMIGNVFTHINSNLATI